MLQITSQAKIETEAVIQYIIDGIPNDEVKLFYMVHGTPANYVQSY